MSLIAATSKEQHLKCDTTNSNSPNRIEKITNYNVNQPAQDAFSYAPSPFAPYSHRAQPPGRSDSRRSQSVSCTRKTVSGDSIEVHYRGSLASDGSEFDSSYGRGQPLKFKVGKGMVIKGWDEGLLDMCVGEKRKLTIAPELAYGDRGAGPIPGGSTLSEWAVAMILP